jgi:hypothetical protein
MRRLYFVVLGLMLLCGQVQAKQDLTVVGISPGMSIDAAAAKLGSDYRKATTSTIQKGEVVNFTTATEAVNILAMGGKSVYIQHQQIFPSTALVSADELTKALMAKYGAPSIRNDDDQSEVWLIVDGKPVPAEAVTDQQRGCVGYDVEGPFFVSRDKNSFSLNYPRVPVQPPLTGCGIVIQAKPTLLPENPGLVTQVTVSLFDIPAAQAWFDAAMADYNKVLKNAVDAARKNKPNL